MRYLILFAFIAAVGLTAGCTGNLEKYITSTKGLVFVYGKDFAFTSFKPLGWVSDERKTITNRLSLYLRPDQETNVSIFAYAVFQLNFNTFASRLGNDAFEIYKEARAFNPKMRMDITTESSNTVDQAFQVVRYRFNGLKSGKGFYEETVYVVWEKAIVAVAMRTGNADFIEPGREQLNLFIKGIKYWGSDSAGLSQRVIKALSKRK